MGEFFTSTFVIVCALGIAVTPVMALIHGRRQQRQDRQRHEMLGRLAADMQAVAERNQAMM